MSEKGLYFVPLGGSEQFGVNLNVYACDGDLLAVDCGLGFADERFPGIDLLLPDPAYLEERRARLKGMIITHAHEDHIGAVARLWSRLKCPIYTGAFTAAVLHEKLKEVNLHTEVPVHVVEALEDFSLGHFDLRFIPVSHSVPDTRSLLIKTSYGQVVHSGDWNLDPAPITGAATNAEHFMAAGREGVLAYVGDSTNAGVRGRSGSESEVADGFEAEFKKCTGKIAVTIFSSNIGRIESIVKAADNVGRSVCVIGRSLHRMVGCAIECGYLTGLPDFITEEDVSYLPDDKVVLICTGSQGEYRAALAKIARGDHPHISLKSGDTVFFSSRAIPGNERHINQVKNHLSAGKINVVTPNDTKSVIHVSGHPCQGEIEDMLQWVKPQVLVPVHGERQQLEAQAEFAAGCQVPQIVLPQNGTLIKLAPGKAEIVDTVHTDLLAVDSKRLIRSDHGSITARRKIQYTGVVHVSIALDQDGAVLGCEMDTIGLIDDRDEGEHQIEDNLYDEIMEILRDMSGKHRRDDDIVQEEVRIGVRRFVSHILGLKPKTTVHVMRV